MTDEDREEVKRIAKDRASLEVGSLVAILILSMVAFGYFVMVPIIDRFTALETQVKELKENKP